MAEAAPMGKRWVPTPVLGYVAAALALLVAGLHLFHPRLGLARLIEILAADPGLLVSHPRPLAFVLVAVAIVAGLYLAIFEVAEGTLMLLGIALMGTLAGGYICWHLTGHGGFLPGRQPHYHGQGPVEMVISHLTNDPWAAVSIISELILALVLAVLYRRAT